MFTIEQAGSIKKVNTIDELIIEYIRTYACKCNSNSSGGNLNAEELNSYLFLIILNEKTLKNYSKI